MPETKDLILKKAEFQDWKQMYENLWRHWESARYMLWEVTTSEEAARERMRRTMAFQQAHPYVWTVYEKKSGQAMGFAGLEPGEAGNWMETGIAFGPAFTGRGYGKQVLRALVEIAASHGASTLTATCREANGASRAMQMACGFRFSHAREQVDPRNGEIYVMEYNVIEFKEEGQEEKMEHYVTYIGQQLQALTAIPSPTGYTQHAAAHVCQVLEAMGYAPQVTRKGNVEVVLGGEGNPLVLAAHIDTLGAMVRSIKANGRLRPTTVAGHNWDTADGENCMIMTRDGRTYTGVVLNKEPSVHVADEKVEKSEENMEILLDENVATKEETQALGIQVGDIIAMDPRTTITPSGYIKSRFLDDKLSASVLLGLAKYVAEEKIQLPRKLTLLFTCYEEVGHGGAHIPADTEDMISVDMGCVGADLECTEQMVSICAKDSGGPYNYQLTTELINIAKAQNLDFAIDVYPHYGSDVEATVRAGYDIRHALVGPGVYASHNYERSHLKGVENTLKLLLGYVGI